MTYHVHSVRYGGVRSTTRYSTTNFSHFVPYQLGLIRWCYNTVYGYYCIILLICLVGNETLKEIFGTLNRIKYIIFAVPGCIVGQRLVC